MPYASQIRTPAGMTFALVAVIVGSILAGLLVLLWIAAMVLTGRVGSPGVWPFLAILFGSLGVYRMLAERRAQALSAMFPDAYALHILVLSGQRKALKAYGKDAGVPVRVPWLGGRYLLVATHEWVRVYAGTSDPSVVLDVPIDRVSNVALTPKKSFFAKQSVLHMELTGPTATWPVKVSAVYFPGITPVAIPEQFYEFEHTAFNDVTHPAMTKSHATETAAPEGAAVS
jgi:hypothetical protein